MPIHPGSLTVTWNLQMDLRKTLLCEAPEKAGTPAHPLCVVQVPVYTDLLGSAEELEFCFTSFVVV